MSAGLTPMSQQLVAQIISDQAMSIRECEL